MVTDFPLFSDLFDCNLLRGIEGGISSRNATNAAALMIHSVMR